MTAEPTATERQAVDQVLGEPDSGWVGGAPLRPKSFAESTMPRPK